MPAFDPYHPKFLTVAMSLKWVMLLQTDTLSPFSAEYMIAYFLKKN